MSMFSLWKISRADGDLTAYTLTFPELAFVRHASGWWIECDGEPLLWWFPSFDNWFYRRYR